MADVPTKPPSTSTKNWGAAVRQAAGDDWHKPDPSYWFDPDGRSRRFNDSGPDHGIYKGTGT